MTPKRYGWLFLLVALACCAGLSSAVAQDSPDAKQLLADSMTFVKGLDALTVNASFHMVFVNGEKTNNVTMDMDISMRGDDDLYLVLTLDDQEARVISNGDARFVYFVPEKEYRPASKVATRAQLIFGTVPRDMRPAVAWMALYLHGKKDLLTIPTHFQYVALEKVATDKGMVPCHHIRTRSDTDWVDAWIQDGKTPYLRKLVMDMSESVRKVSGVEADATLVVTETFPKWDSAPALDDSLFAFTPPEGVTLPPPPGSEPLLGKMAPVFKLPLLGGGTMDLAKHRGKAVVVLDFWTTWCPGCRAGMPIAADVTSKYPAGKVAFYAVNLREPEELIKKFVADTKVTARIALDKKGEAAMAYRVGAIPRTVVIDRNGKVVAGHEGAGPDYRRQLKSDIDAALKVPLTP